MIYGGNIELGYKGIDFALYFQGVAGNDIWVGTKALLRQTSITNLLAETYTDAWRNPVIKPMYSELPEKMIMIIIEIRHGMCRTVASVK